jgi:Tfp pilus assembly PilM family ATPase
MSRILALEWDSREARVVVARRRGRTAVIEQAFAEPWEGAAPALDRMLAAHGLRRVDTLVAVGRASIELRLLSLPPVPPEELPDIVRFQALKQFSSVGEDWPIDFVPVSIKLSPTGTPGPVATSGAASGVGESPSGVAGGGGNAGGAAGTVSSGTSGLGADASGKTASDRPDSTQVLAAAIAPELIRQVRATCAAAEVEPKRIVLRPYAAAALWQHHGRAPGCLLMVDLLAEEVDLTVLIDGQVVFIRTVKLPQGEAAEETARWLAGESKRTLAAAANQLGGRRADRVVLCGDTDDYAPVRRAYEKLINLPLELFDPFDGLTLEQDVAAERPTHRGRFAALLGMVVEEAAGVCSGIDFLNPRRPPKPPDRRRLYSLAGGAAAAVALGLGFYVWSQLADYEQQTLAIKAETAEVDAEIKRLEKSVRESQSVDEFVAGDVTWLDELYTVSNRFLPAEQAIASQLSCLVQQGGGGQLIIEGHVKQSSLLDDLESRLRDPSHHVNGSGGTFDPRQPIYPWQFKESIQIDAATASTANASTANATTANATTKSPATKTPATKTPNAPPAKTLEKTPGTSPGKTPSNSPGNTPGRTAENSTEKSAKNSVEVETAAWQVLGATPPPSLARVSATESATESAIQVASNQAAATGGAR